MQNKKPSANIKEGIEGYVYQSSGNQMPMKGKPARSGKKGIIAEVYIYKGTTLQQVSGSMPLFSQISTPLVAKVKTDSTGYFHAALPVGLYSVFVKQGNQYFAAETNSEGILNSVEVIGRQIAERNITVNTNALY